MEGLLDAALANPWATMDRLVDGPLHPGGREATERLLDRAGVESGTRVLDVGCGAGHALALARDRGARAWGVDPDPAADRAVRGTATALPVRTDSVDVVLAECVLCLTDIERALGEVERVLAPGGRLALSDVVVVGEAPQIPERAAQVLCLTGARSRDRLVASVADAGFRVGSVADHHEDLLAMRDEVASKVDYERLLGLMGERGRRVQDVIDGVEAAVEEGRIGYVSVVATR
jgi:SAM-dependent methyltransferase